MRPSRSRIVAAFAAVYIVWGSTYLAIRIAIDTLPPFLMAATRFLAAGAIMYAWGRLRGAAAPSPAHWRAAAVVGGLLLFSGNGALVWSELYIPTGVAALIVATTPLWMVLLDWARPGGVRPRALVFAGLAIGLAGLVLLVGPGVLRGTGEVPPFPFLVLLAGTLSWAGGSVYSRHAPRPAEGSIATAMQMLAGGAMLLLLGLVLGEGAALRLPAVSARSAMALAYLVVFGSLVAYSAYVWLLKVSTTARVATYAYVNPVVAVLLGWAVLGERLTPRSMAAAGVILAGVALITAARTERDEEPGRPTESPSQRYTDCMSSRS